MSKHPVRRRAAADRPVTPAGPALAGGAAVAGRTGENAFGVLAAARESRRAADEHEVRILALAVEWARLHQVDDVDDAAQWFAPGAGAVGIAIAGEGAPLVAEWAVAEFATVLGLSTDAGKRLISEALELAYRLPRLWARVGAGEVTAWRGRRVATETGHLSIEAAAYVDRHVASFAHSTTGPGVERLVADAVARFMPEYAEELAVRAADGRCFEVDHQQVSFAGTSRVYGELDLADAIDLDVAVTAGAEQLKAPGSPDSLDARRSMAAGQLARRQLALGFDDASGQTGGSAVVAGQVGDVVNDSIAIQASGSTEDLIRAKAGGSTQPAATDQAGDTATRSKGRQPQPDQPTQPVREVVIYAHLAAEAITGSTDGVCDSTGRTGSGSARVENTGTKLLTPAQVAAWCGTDAARITVRPVIDLNDQLTSTSYEIPDRIREQIILRDRTCRFPYCNRTARRADIDHTTPWHAGGKTTTANLAVLCRRHHRYKTHHHWNYRRTGPATYEWTSPHGYHYTVTPEGTTPLTPAPVPGPRDRGLPDPANRARRAGIPGTRAVPAIAEQHHRPSS